MQIAFLSKFFVKLHVQFIYYFHVFSSIILSTLNKVDVKTTDDILPKF